MLIFLQPPDPNANEPSFKRCVVSMAMSFCALPQDLGYRVWRQARNVAFKGQLGVPLTVYPWHLLCSLGILGDYNP